MTTSFPAHFFLTRKDHGSKSARLFLVIFCLNNFILGVFAPALTFLDPRAPTIVLRSEMENIFSTSRSLLVAMKNILWHKTLLSLILFFSIHWTNENFSHMQSMLLPLGYNGFWLFQIFILTHPVEISLLFPMMNLKVGLFTNIFQYD